MVKCRAVAQVANEKKFDAGFFAAITGTPWRQSPRHNSWKIRTGVDGDEHFDEVPEDSYVVKSDMNEDVEEAMKMIRESKRIIQERAPTTHSFHITQSDMALVFDAMVANTYWGEFRTKWHTLRIAEKDS